MPNNINSKFMYFGNSANRPMGSILGSDHEVRGQICKYRFDHVHYVSRLTGIEFQSNALVISQTSVDLPGWKENR